MLTHEVLFWGVGWYISLEDLEAIKLGNDFVILIYFD